MSQTNPHQRAMQVDLESLEPQKALEALYSRQRGHDFGLIDMPEGCTVSQMIGSLPPDRREQAARLLKDESPDAPVIQRQAISVGPMELTVIKNLARPLRRLGLSKTRPASDPHAVNGGCLLCWENLPPDQLGVSLAGGRWVGLVNPFPLVPGHLTISLREHRDNESIKTDELSGILDDLLKLSQSCAGYWWGLNGPTTGASVAPHLHAHATPLPLPPIFSAPVEPISDADAVTTSVVRRPWPCLAIVHESHDPAALARRFVKDLRSWAGCNAVWESTRGRLRVIVSPRLRRQPPRLGNAWACSEMAGLVVIERSADWAVATDAANLLDGLAWCGVPREGVAR